MDEKNLLPVMIHGGGPTGLTLALELARRGVACRILDSKPEAMHRGRGGVVLGTTLDIMRLIGVEEAAFADAERSRGVGFFSRGERIGSLEVSPRGARYDFEVVLSGAEVEEILLAPLAAHGITVEYGFELIDFTRDARSATGMFRRSDGTREVIQAGWMVGCDGHQGMTRRLLGESLPPGAEASAWAALDCRLEGPLPSERRVTVLLERGVFTLIPVRGDHWRVYFQPSQDDSDLLTDLQAGLDLHLPGVVAHDPEGEMRFSSSGWIASRYRQGRVLLAGEEAHHWSPIEGHGLNTGIQDAHNLGWKLALIEKGVCEDTLLESYEIERRSVAEAIVASGDRNVAILQEEDRTGRASIRPESVALSRDLSTSRHWAEATSEFLSTYRCSPIVSGEEGPQPHNPSPGDRLPPAGFVTSPRSEVCSVQDLSDRTSHLLLCLIRGALHGEHRDELARLVAVTARFPGIVGRLCIVSDQPSTHEEFSESWFHAENLKPFSVLGEERASVLLIRPDLYIGYRSAGIAPSALEDYLRSLSRGRTG